MSRCGDCANYMPTGAFNGQCKVGNDLLQDLGIPTFARVQSTDEALCRAFKPSLDYLIQQVRCACGDYSIGDPDHAA